jgi:hypothetical protein
MTKIDLDRLERLAKAATPGPWTHKSDINGLSNFVYKGSGMRRQVARTLKLSDDSDAAFIAALNPAVALALIAEVRGSRTDLAEEKESSDYLLREKEKWEIWSVLQLDTDAGLIDQEHRDAATAALQARGRGTR